MLCLVSPLFLSYRWPCISVSSCSIVNMLLNIIPLCQITLFYTLSCKQPARSLIRSLVLQYAIAMLLERSIIPYSPVPPNNAVVHSLPIKSKLVSQLHLFQSPQLTTFNPFSLATIIHSTSSILPPAFTTLLCSSQTATNNCLVR